MMEERGSPGMTTNKNKAGSNPGLFFVIANEAIHLPRSRKHGLLRRFAPRNDGADDAR
jgi:hypothetical protein